MTRFPLFIPSVPPVRFFSHSPPACCLFISLRSRCCSLSGKTGIYHPSRSLVPASVCGYPTGTLFDSIFTVNLLSISITQHPPGVPASRTNGASRGREGPAGHISSPGAVATGHFTYPTLPGLGGWCVRAGALIYFRYRAMATLQLGKSIFKI